MCCFSIFSFGPFAAHSVVPFQNNINRAVGHRRCWVCALRCNSVSCIFVYIFSAVAVCSIGIFYSLSFLFSPHGPCAVLASFLLFSPHGPCAVSASFIIFVFIWSPWTGFFFGPHGQVFLFAVFSGPHGPCAVLASCTIFLFGALAFCSFCGFLFVREFFLAASIDCVLHQHLLMSV